MAAASVDQSLTRIITCPVCSGDLNKQTPRELSCRHVLCEGCIQNMIDRTKLKSPDDLNKIVCPICKIPIVVHGGQAASLPCCFLAIEISDVRKQLRDRHEICQICETDTHTADISSYCFTCSSGFCQSCRLNHDSVNQDHRTTKLETVKKAMNKQPIKGVPEATVTNLDHLMADVRKQIPATDFNIDIPSELHFIPGTDDICLGEIVEDVTSSSLNRQPTLLWQTETRLGVTDIEFLDNNHIIVVTDREVFVYNEKRQEIPHYLSRVSQDMSGESVLWGVSVNRDKSKVVFVEYKDRNVEGCLHVYIKQHVDWSYKKYVVCKRPGYVSFTNTDDYLVASLSDYKIYKYNQQGIQVMSLQMSAYIYGLCVDNKNRIIVCLEKEVSVHDENGTKILTLQKRDTELNLRDVCVSLDDNIIVCDDTSQSVLLFDKDGVFIKNLLTLNISPWKISLYQSKYLALSDWKDNAFVYKLY